MVLPGDWRGINKDGVTDWLARFLGTGNARLRLAALGELRRLTGKTLQENADSSPASYRRLSRKWRLALARTAQAEKTTPGVQGR